MGKRKSAIKHKASAAQTQETEVKATEIPPEQYFVLCDGTPIKSIDELALMMDQISDDVFDYHVNEEKNDFSNWVKDVFDKEELAKSLATTRCRKESQIALLKHAVTKGKR